MTLKELKHRVPVSVSEKLQNQVRFLCERIWTDEWSGTLFYNTVGTFGEDDFAITAEELYLLDIGNGTYTEYDPADPAVIKFMMGNPTIRRMKRGHIHSHNNMAVFFSGTDNDELIENSEFHNFYFSLIVNNKNEMCAKVAFRAQSKSATKTTFSFKDQDGKDIVKEYDSDDEKTQVYAYGCDVKKPEAGEDFSTRFLELKETKKKLEEEKAKSRSTIYTGGIGAGVGSGWKPYPGELFDGEDYTVKGKDEKAWEKPGKWEKGHEKGEMGLSSTNSSIRSTRTDPRVYNMLIKLLSLDHTEETAKLGEVMKSLHDKYYREFDNKIYVNPTSYYERLVKESTDFYMSSFPEDLQFIGFDKAMEACVSLVETYDNQYPALSEKLSKVLNLELK